jgi:hypothetical protein
MRVVVRENFSRDMAKLFLTHLKDTIDQLNKEKAPTAKREMGIC